MLKRIHLAAIGAVAMLASGVVAAQAGIGGPGFKRSEAAQPTTMTRERAAVIREPAQVAPSLDGWQYVGGEAVWILAPHEYAFRDGGLIYVDKRFPHDTPAALKPTAQEQARLQTQVGGR